MQNRQVRKDAGLPAVLNTLQVAEILGLQDYTVRIYCREGLLKAEKIRFSWRIRREDLALFAEKEGRVMNELSEEKTAPGRADFLTPDEVGRLLRYTRKQITIFCAQGQIPAVKIFGRWRIKRSDVQRLIDGGG